MSLGQSDSNISGLTDWKIRRLIGRKLTNFVSRELIRDAHSKGQLAAL